MPFVGPSNSTEHSLTSSEVLAYGVERRKGAGTVGESQNIDVRFPQAVYNLFDEFRLNLVTNCLSESQFPHLPNEAVGKEFSKHCIQWQ